MLSKIVRRYFIAASASCIFHTAIAAEEGILCDVNLSSCGAGAELNSIVQKYRLDAFLAGGVLWKSTSELARTGDQFYTLSFELYGEPKKTDTNTCSTKFSTAKISVQCDANSNKCFPRDKKPPIERNLVKIYFTDDGKCDKFDKRAFVNKYSIDRQVDLSIAYRIVTKVADLEKKSRSSGFPIELLLLKERFVESPLLNIKGIHMSGESILFIYECADVVPRGFSLEVARQDVERFESVANLSYKVRRLDLSE